jgi:hypothetical protein
MQTKRLNIANAKSIKIAKAEKWSADVDMGEWILNASRGDIWLPTTAENDCGHRFPVGVRARKRSARRRRVRAIAMDDDLVTQLSAVSNAIDDDGVSDEIVCDCCTLLINDQFLLKVHRSLFLAHQCHPSRATDWCAKLPRELRPVLYVSDATARQMFQEEW